LTLYSGWRRETFVAPRSALLAIDLYDLVYRGGPHSPYELNERYPNSCGIFAHRAIRADQAAAGGRPPRRHSRCSTARRRRAPTTGRAAPPSTRRQAFVPPDGYAIYHEFTPEPSDVRDLEAARQHLPRDAAVLAPVAARRAEPDRLRREHVRMRAGERGRRLFEPASTFPVVEECTYDRAELTHKVNLFDLHHKYADVMHVDEVVWRISSPCAWIAPRE
jgi:hypothetical protein